MVFCRVTLTGPAGLANTLAGLAFAMGATVKVTAF